jgi:hypothetical protein
MRQYPRSLGPSIDRPPPCRILLNLRTIRFSSILRTDLNGLLRAWPSFASARCLHQISGRYREMGNGIQLGGVEPKSVATRTRRANTGVGYSFRGKCDRLDAEILEGS